MKKLFHIIISIIGVTFMLSACVDEELPTADTPQGNLDALWQLMDERYCFFDYKKAELGVDWNEVHDRYRKKLSPKMTTLQLFEVCCAMIAELKDGHVNLGASFNLGRNWSYWEDEPENYYDSIARSYLGHEYGIASSLRYTVLDDNIGYVRCSSFENGPGDGNVSNVLAILAPCNGLIIGIRNNGGGSLVHADNLASHFTNEKVLVGYIYHKTGKGHNDFSAMKAEYLEPAKGTRWQKPVVVITNRQCFSAANDFVKMMRCLPNVTLLGDKTGGGSGMPFTQEIPCGWSVRYSAVVSVDKDKQHIEFGIEPDVKVSMDMTDVNRKKDTLIERARAILNQKHASTNP